MVFILSQVRTALSNPYLSFAEALNGLAGPQQSQIILILHGERSLLHHDHLVLAKWIS